jgi:peptidoglycan/LPS O-acetylase OafA/YrhL
MGAQQARITAENAAGAGGSKLLGLELLRFACAIVVLMFHFQHFAMIGDGVANEPLTLRTLLWPIYDYGRYGVEVFWSISGFIFYWKYADAIHAGLVGARRFFWLRFSRLYPLHLLTLLIVAALQPAYAALAGKPFVYGNGTTDFILQLGLADQWPGSRALSFNGPIWSVSAEVFVYLLFYLVMRAFGRRLWLIPVAAGFASIGIGLGGPSAPMVCVGYFFTGGAAAEWLRCERARTRPGEARLIAALLILAAVACLAVVADGAPDQPQVLLFLMAATPPALFVLAQDMPWLVRWQRPIEIAGNLTYSTYLIHFPMQLAFAIAALGLGLTVPVGEPWFLAAYLAAVLGAGRLVFLRFEGPMQDAVRKLALAPARTPAVAPA